MKQTITVDVDTTPTLETASEILMHIAELVEGAYKHMSTCVDGWSPEQAQTIMRLQQANDEGTKALVSAQQEIDALTKATQNLIRERDEARSAQGHHAPGQQLLWWKGGRTFHIKPNCNVGHAAATTQQVWWAKESYLAAVERKDAALCTGCHGWTKHGQNNERGGMPALGEMVKVKPHGRYENWTTGVVKGFKGRGAKFVTVQVKNHPGPLDIERKFIGRFVQGESVDNQV